MDEIRKKIREHDEILSLWITFWPYRQPGVILSRLFSTFIVVFLIGSATESRRILGQWPSDHDRIVASEIKQNRADQDRSQITQSIQNLNEDIKRYQDSTNRRMEDLRNDYTSLYNRFVGGGLVLIFLNIGPLVMGLLRKNGNNGNSNTNSSDKVSFETQRP